MIQQRLKRKGPIPQFKNRDEEAHFWERMILPTTGMISNLLT